MTIDLARAVENFLSAYRAKYENHGKGGIRSNAPMRSEVAKLNSVYHDLRLANRKIEQ